MKSLTSKQVEQLSDLQAKLQSSSQKVESAIADFNANVNELWGDLVLDSVNKYNNLVKQAQDFAEATAGNIQNYYNSQSEDWQQGNEGDAYQDWIDEWDEADLQEIEPVMPDETDVPDFPAVEAIDGLSAEPSL